MQERRWLVEGVERPDADALDVYRRNGGYDGAWRAFDEIDPAAVIDEVEAAGLRGHGGAWRPVAARWRAAGALRGVRALLVDVSESESGRFRDRKLAERLPHRLIEGALIAAHALTADDVYLCVRADWRRARSVLEHAMDEARAAGWIDRALGRSGHAVRLHLHPVPGPLPARGTDQLLPHLIECSRPEPRASNGTNDLPTLFGAPVLVHTAATLAFLPAILARGSGAFRELGSADFPGTVAISVSGHIRRPGLFEVEIGSGSFGELIDTLAGGVVDETDLLAVFPGGAPALDGDALKSLQIDPGVWSQPGGGEHEGSFGCGTIVVADDAVTPLDLAARWLDHAAQLGCGQCPMCREGSVWLIQHLQRLREGGVTAIDPSALQERLEILAHGEGEGLAICGHPTVAAHVTQGLLQIAPEHVDSQASAGATPIDDDAPLRTADSIHLRF